jgi:hypothetical protein
MTIIEFVKLHEQYPMGQTISNYTTIAQNIVLALSGVATVVIAYFGLSTWKNELKGKSEYSKAKDVLKAVYKVKRGFMHVRNPAIWAYEYPEEMRNFNGNLKPEFDYEGTTHVYDNRWKYLGEAFLELEEQNLEAQVEWGPEFQDIIIPLRRCKAELQMAIQDMLDAKRESSERHLRTRELLAEDRSTLYYSGEDSKHDKFTPEINAAILLFEKRLRPLVKR